MADNFYAVNNLSQPLAQLYTAARYAENEACLKLIPEPEEDLELVPDRRPRHYGQSVEVVTKTFLALQRLTSELPQLYAVLQKHWHLDFPRVIAIDTALSKLGNDAGEDIIQEIDGKIAHYLTPQIGRAHV